MDAQVELIDVPKDRYVFCCATCEEQFILTRVTVVKIEGQDEPLKILTPVTTLSDCPFCGEK